MCALSDYPSILIPHVLGLVPEFVLQTLEYVEDNRADRDVLDCLDQPEHELVLVKVWERAAIIRTIHICGATIAGEKRARLVVEGFVEVLCANGRVSMVEETGEARGILEDIVVSRGVKGRSNEYSNLNLDVVEVAPKLVQKDVDLARMVQRAIEKDKELRKEQERRRSH